MTEQKQSSIIQHPDRLKKVQHILISQPQPETDKNPYTDLAKKYNLQVDFRPFIQVEAVGLKEFRKQKINILDHTAVIFTSRNSVDHFFKLCEESRLEMPPEMKYFCISEQTSNYLQKYITIRKRKIFVGKRVAADLYDLLKKHKTERFLYPCSEVKKDDIPAFLERSGLKYSEAVIYHTVSSNLSDLDLAKYDMIAFFSPSGVTSLFSNFPDYQQGTTLLAAFGPTTAKAVTDHGLLLDVQAPHPNAPSMTGAIELYIKESAQ
jgi:uroporphyrinogen-III synthase